MYSDLCVPISDTDLPVSLQASAPRVRDTLAALQRLGYGCVALETATSLPLRPRDACRRLAPLLPSAGAPMPPVVRAGSASTALNAAAVVLGARGGMPSKRAARRLARAASAAQGGAAGAGRGGGGGGGGSGSGGGSGGGGDSVVAGRKRTRAPSPAVGARGALVQLQRLTVEVRGGGEGVVAQLLEGAAIFSSYDLVAAAPLDGGAFAACVAAARRGAPLDVLSVDATSSAGLPFPLSRAEARDAVSAGLVFELRYGGALRDAAGRRAFLACAAALRRTAGGSAALLLSSGALGALEPRAPGDVGAVVGLAGWPPHAAGEALAAAPAAALAHAAARKTVGGGAAAP
jgi:hypothetical protein